MRKRLNLIIVAIGIILLVVGAIEFKKYKDEHNAYRAVEATINEVKLNGEVTIVGFEYLLNGKYYFSTVTTSENFEVGNKQKIYYLKSDPDICKVHLISITKSVIFFVSGGLVLLLGIVLSIKRLIEKNRIKLLKKKGMLIKASIQEVLVVNKNRGKNPYKIRASYINPQDNKTYVYISKEEKKDLKDIVSRNNIKFINVYINPKDTADYYVDIESIVS